MKDQRQACDYKILYLGPKNTYSHMAAKEARQKVAELLKNRSEAQVTSTDINLVAEPDARKILDALELSDKSFAVVPIANSKVGDVFDFMPFYGFQMVAEIPQEIDLWLCNKTGRLEDVKLVVTKNTAYDQVKKQLNQISPGLPFQPTDSTAEGAKLAADDETKAAVCGMAAAKSKGLKEACPRLALNVTTFGVFRNEPRSFPIPLKAEVAFNALLRGARLYSGRVIGGGPQEFAQALAQKNKKLKIKWGVDPLRPSLHLGHLANIRKLGFFLEFGHDVTVVLGTFTGKIGDPSGNLEQRERLNDVELHKNAQLMKAQITAVLGDSVRFVENHKLCESLSVERLLQWGYKIDVRLLSDRRDFIQRKQSDMPLHLSELLYGLFQAYDSVMLETDVEVGGMDQLWNCVLMRDIMAMERQQPAFALLLQLVPGIDGSEKMSSFEKNDVKLSEPRSEILIKLGQVKNPKHILTYMRLLTSIPEERIGDWEESLQQRAITVQELSRRMVEEVMNSLPDFPGQGPVT